MRRTFLKVVIFSAVLFHVSVTIARQNSPDNQETQKVEAGELSKDDQAEIIKLTLELALMKKEIPDYSYLEKQGYVPLSTENISAELVPEIKGFKLLLLEPKKIKELADSSEGYVYYLHFDKFRIKDSKVFVSLDNDPMYGKNASVMAFGGGIVVEFQKKDGKWVGEIWVRRIV